MRPIKFRGKSLQTDKWVEGMLIKNKLGCYIVTEDNPHECTRYGYLEINEYERVIPETVGQYTGLKDKNHVDICSNYVLLITGEKGKFRAKVIYETGTFGIVALKGSIVDYFPDHWNDDYMPLIDLYWNYNNDENIIVQVEVIGDIYENPELLEGESE